MAPNNMTTSIVLFLGAIERYLDGIITTEAGCNSTDPAQHSLKLECYQVIVVDFPIPLVVVF